MPEGLARDGRIECISKSVTSESGETGFRPIRGVIVESGFRWSHDARIEVTEAFLS
jgi:hypothetical protein